MAHPLSSPTPRRGFLQRLAAAAAAFSAGGWSVAEATPTRAGDVAPDAEAWVDRIKGKHRQVFDCVTPNDGFGAAYALNYIDSYKQAQGATDADVTAVVSYRHMAMPLMLNDAMWTKYKIGEVIGVKDPKTGAPATRNVFRDAILMRPGLTYERMASERGVILTACNMALTVLSGMAAPKAGVAADAAKKEWTANVLPGVTVVPSGVYAVNRAQEKGCAYCYGG